MKLKLGARKLSELSNLELAEAIAASLEDGSFESECYRDAIIENFVEPLRAEKKAAEERAS